MELKSLLITFSVLALLPLHAPTASATDGPNEASGCSVYLYTAPQSEFSEWIESEPAPTNAGVDPDPPRGGVGVYFHRTGVAVAGNGDCGTSQAILCLLEELLKTNPPGQDVVAELTNGLITYGQGDDPGDPPACIPKIGNP